MYPKIYKNDKAPEATYTVWALPCSTPEPQVSNTTFLSSIDLKSIFRLENKQIFLYQGILIRGAPKDVLLSENYLDSFYLK